MKDYFYERTNNHIQRVKLNAIYLSGQMPAIRDGLIFQVDHHDASKLKAPEIDPYIVLTWKYKMQDLGEPYKLPEGMDERIHEATLHHITSNKHHPEYHDPNFSEKSLNRQDRDAQPKKPVDGTHMDVISIAEMCCDWCSMSQERQGSNDATPWAKQTINKRWNFDNFQEDDIYKFLIILKNQ